jgi:hypothetical protein
MNNHILTILITTLLFPGTLFAQNDFAKLKSLQGSWSGEGYQQMGQQNRVEFKQTEEISLLLEGNILLIHGTGLDKSTNKKGFEAVGVMYYDPTEDATFMHAWTIDGRYTKAPVEITTEGFAWGFEVDNGGTVRYEAKITENSWVEQGAYSPDGNQWYPFMQMELKRNP